MKTLLLIDANSLLYRCFHALPPLTASDGRPAQAVYGLASVLLKLFREASPGRPEYAAALFDRPEPTFRKIQYAEYKAQRPPTPDDLIAQIGEARALFRTFGVPVFEKAGIEADDLIASLAVKFQDEPDIRIVILTGDMDTLQLVRGDKVVVRALRKGVSDTFVYDESEVKKRYGLKPSQMIDYKALVGDSSDNIKGVLGIGPKTAADLLERFDTLERVVEHMDSLPQGTREKLSASAAALALAKELVTLKKDVELGVSAIGDLAVAYDAAAVKSYFEWMGFSALARRLDGVPGAPASREKGNVQGAIF